MFIGTGGGNAFSTAGDLVPFACALHGSKLPKVRSFLAMNSTLNFCHRFN
jgi:hypothetical protein